LERPALPAISEVAAPRLRLAGDRIDPRLNIGSNEPTFTALRVRDVAGGERAVQAPAGVRLAYARWSPDGRRVAFAALAGDSIAAAALWVADAPTGAARRLGDVTLNGAAGAPCRWLGNDALVCRALPGGRGPAPVAPTIPAGPIVQETEGAAAPNRTYQDLLQSPHDEALFDHYFTSQVVVIGLDGAARPLGKPGVHVTAEPSPDGRYLLVETAHRPYSYVVPLERFPRLVEVRGIADGAVVRQVADVPLQERVPAAFDAVPTGPRNVGWRADAPATLVWAEALDGGDPARAVAKRDRLTTLAAPFAGEPAALAEVEFRIEDVTWGTPSLALLEEGWWRTRRARTWVLDPSRPGSASRLLFDRSSEDRYAEPGRFLTRVNASGERVLLLGRDGRTGFLAGQGASAEGDRPFLDRIDLGTAKTARLWRSAAPFYEEVVTLLDAEGRRALTRRESADSVPNYYVRDVRAGRLTKLTSFADPAPELAGISKQLLTYRRDDGVQLSATLYLPKAYDRTQGPLPFLFWAYPREFKTAAAAAQVIGSPYRFTRPTGASHLFALTQGYGVLDGPTMPIVGEGDREPNDTYVKQLVASAKAAVDKVVEMGVADRGRIAIGGHSYGAFMAANLLAHSSLFRAGIARSGAYNRTLTPFGFQQEERTYWQARDIYHAMSPFNYADSIAAPLLLIHGMADDNSGTFPVQTDRFFAALKGHGKTVRYVQLPAEAHGYRARESVGHTLWEMVTWLDKWVKPTPRTAEVLKD
ncbi:MAG TPA: prolyl oligopeptidase family serine peptidase, partial [Gemmatimonadaceae bacterium]|nr:prolyl oligopeptidase family serine peptidase [Gemmatimonadaceae bacterium]